MFFYLHFSLFNCHTLANNHIIPHLSSTILHMIFNNKSSYFLDIVLVSISLTILLKYFFFQSLLRTMFCLLELCNSN